MTQQRKSNRARCCTFVACIGIAAAAAAAQQHDRDWLKRVRIAAYPLSSTNAEEIVRQAKASHVYGIEVDNDIPGRYESYLHPEAKLDAIRKIATAAHAQGEKAFVYVAGFECITADGSASHTVFKDHPEWLQRKITGEPAIFDNKAAFWIAKGEEDVWVSPYADDWRRGYMQRIEQIAATGIDGIYVDIPYWMTHFTGWEDTWASFDDATVAAFKKQTGLDARKDIKLGDFDDPGFQKWIDFRIDTITRFMAEIRQRAIRVNPDISVIPEIYPGIEQESVRVGADVFQLYPVVDAIAHEYEFGEGDDHTAASRSPFDWMMYQIGMRSFRAFAGDKPTWILNYSWDGAPHVKPAEAMQTLFMSEIMAGANVWDASTHVMSGSNDMAERKTVYAWIEKHEDIFGNTRTPMGEIGVYFSDRTRNDYPKEFLESYRGTLLLLLQTHRQFQVVTERNIRDFHGSVLVMPDVRILSADELANIQQFVSAAGRLVITGAANASFDKMRGAQVLPDDPARQYLESAEKDFNGTGPEKAHELLEALGDVGSIKVDASPNLVVHAALISGSPYLFIANFAGIKPGEQLAPEPEVVRVTVPASYGSTMHLLAYLGSETLLRGQRKGDTMQFTIPRVDRGAVASFQ